MIDPCRSKAFTFKTKEQLQLKWPFISTHFFFTKRTMMSPCPVTGRTCFLINNSITERQLQNFTIPQTLKLAIIFYQIDLLSSIVKSHLNGWTNQCYHSKYIVKDCFCSNVVESQNRKEEKRKWRWLSVSTVCWRSWQHDTYSRGRGGQITISGLPWKRNILSNPL